MIVLDAIHRTTARTAIETSTMKSMAPVTARIRIAKYHTAVVIWMTWFWWTAVTVTTWPIVTTWTVIVVGIYVGVARIKMVSLRFPSLLFPLSSSLIFPFLCILKLHIPNEIFCWLNIINLRIIDFSIIPGFTNLILICYDYYFAWFNLIWSVLIVFSPTAPKSSISRG